MKILGELLFEAFVRWPRALSVALGADLGRTLVSTLNKEQGRHTLILVSNLAEIA